MSSYILKINASPITIKRVGLDKIRSEFIPTLLRSAFGDGNMSSSYQLSDSVFDLYNDPEYHTLLKETANFRTMYSSVLNHYKRYGDFSYTKEFLSVIDALKKRRKHLERKHPIIEHAYHISNERAKAGVGLELTGRIGTGVDHLVKMSKLEIFLETRIEDASYNNVPKTFSYSNDELIVMPSSSPLEMYECARTLEAGINRSQPHRIRKSESIHINPVFKKVVLTKQKCARADLEIIVDYPNGDPSIEYSAMILGLLEETDSRSATISLNAANLESVEENVQPLAQKGYLRDVTSQGKTMIDCCNSSYETREG